LPAPSSRPTGRARHEVAIRLQGDDLHGAAEVTFKEQDEILARSISIAKQFKTGRSAASTFGALDDVAPLRAAIDEKLRSAAETAGKQGILLVLENE